MEVERIANLWCRLGTRVMFTSEYNTVDEMLLIAYVPNHRLKSQR